MHAISDSNNEEFTLIACRLLKGRFAPKRGEQPRTFTWRELIERLAPTRSKAAMASLRQARPGYFVGLFRHPLSGQARTFLFFNHNGDHKDARWFIKRQPGFAQALLEVYRVEDVKLVGGIEETSSASNGGHERA